VLVESVVPVLVSVAVKVVLSLETVLVAVPVVVPVMVVSEAPGDENSVETAIDVTEPALSVDSEKIVETALEAEETSEKIVETGTEVTEPALSVDADKMVEMAEDAPVAVVVPAPVVSVVVTVVPVETVS
jgi:hypothetical protein